MVAPGRWQDDGPGQARLPGFGGSLVTPRVAVKVYVPAAKSTGAPKAYSLHPERRIKPEDMCEVVLLLARVPCSRTRGHGGSHRSAEVMENDRMMRRTHTRGLGA